MTDKHRRFLGPVVEMRKLHDSAEQRIVHSAEMLDRKSLASVGDTTGERLTALLTETKAHTPEELAANVARIGELLGRFALYVPARFTDDPAEQAKYWAVRSGIFPAVGGSRPAGTMLWFSDQIPTDQLERELVSLTIDGLSLKEAVYVEPITGRIYDLSCVILRGGMSGGKIRFSRLPLWDSPIFIMEKSCVPFKPGKE